MHNLVMNMQFNPPKTYFVSGNILGKQSASYFILTDEYFIKCLSLTVN